MTQSVLVLLFALASGLLGAAVIADSTFSKTQRLRVLRLCLIIAVVVGIAYAIVALDLRCNFTPSMPLGIYRLAPVPKSGVQRGMLLAVCAPRDVANLGRRRGYLGIGPCSPDAEPLLKVVAAVPGDLVTVSANGVAVDGCPLPHSRPLALDSGGRRLSGWRHGQFQLRRGQLWLYASNNRSWDSRYWGPASATAIVARAIPLLTLSGKSGHVGCPNARRKASRGASAGALSGTPESTSEMKRCQ
jgi:conjugative transfer signal peptidase TraF